MHHLVSVSVAPVILVTDDQANPLSLTAIPLTFALWLPAWLYAWLSGMPAAGDRLAAYACGPVLSYIEGWAADLALMTEAAVMLLTGRWVFMGAG